jgi:hypothetical protein
MMPSQPSRQRHHVRNEVEPYELDPGKKNPFLSIDDSKLVITYKPPGVCSRLANRRSSIRRKGWSSHTDALFGGKEGGGVVNHSSAQLGLPAQCFTAVTPRIIDHGTPCLVYTIEPVRYNLIFRGYISI